MDKETAEKVLKELVMENVISLTNADELNDGIDLVEDLGYDSISLIQLITDIERRFHIYLPDEYLQIETISEFKKLKECVFTLID